MAMVDDVSSGDGRGGIGKRMNQDGIYYKAVFSVWSERAVERWQEVRFRQVRRMSQIFVNERQSQHASPMRTEVSTNYCRIGSCMTRCYGLQQY